MRRTSSFWKALLPGRLISASGNHALCVARFIEKQAYFSSLLLLLSLSPFL